MLAVVHIHKTAGTTLAGALKYAFGPRFCAVAAEDPDAPFLSTRDLERLQRRFYPRLDAILGHDVRAYSDLGRDRAVEYVAYMRDPLERCASHYQYDVQRGGVDLPFEEWITHEAVPNRQTRIIGGPGATADDAISLLGRFSFIGVLNRFDEGLVMMRKSLDLPDMRYARKWVAPSDGIKARLLADPASLELLEEANRHDMALWQHVVEEIYPKQLAAHGPDLDAEVRRFRDANAGTTVKWMYRQPRYAGYVAKWRLLYNPWVQRKRRATADSR